MASISLKAQQMPASAIRKLVPLSDAAKKQGVKVYHLNIGQPDIKSPDCALEAVRNLKLKNVTLGYTFPRKWTRKAKIDRLRIYVTGNNLLTFTKFTGLDPEFAGAAKTAYGVYYGSTYPQTRMVAFGVDISF